MLKTKFMVFFLSIITVFVAGTDRLLSQNRQELFSRPVLQDELFTKPFLDFKSYNFLPDSYTFQNNKPASGLKSPKKAMLFSLIVPGSGEFYSKSWIKGVIFLGIEIGSWITYSSYQKQGKDIEEEYIQFAEENWNKEKWEYWFNIKLSDDERERYAHHELPDTKTQQYYEMIGKYQKFNAGWFDIWKNDRTFENYDVNKDTSDLSLDYMDIRGQSNEKLKIAATATAIVLANHVLSALNAIWTTNRYNKKVTSSVSVAYLMINNRPKPVTKLTINW